MPKEILILYHEDDSDIGKRLCTFFSLITYSGDRIVTWTSEDVLPGNNVKETLYNFAGRADIILLVITVDFFTNEIIYEIATESTPSKVYCVLGKPCTWELNAKVRQLKFVNEKSVVEFALRDKAFESIVRQVYNILKMQPSNLPDTIYGYIQKTFSKNESLPALRIIAFLAFIFGLLKVMNIVSYPIETVGIFLLLLLIFYFLPTNQPNS